MEVGILFNPVDKRPHDKAKRPVAHDFLFMPNLKMVEIEGILEFLEGVFDTPAQAIDGSSFFVVKREVISDEDMAGFVIFI